MLRQRRLVIGALVCTLTFSLVSQMEVLFSQMKPSFYFFQEGWIQVVRACYKPCMSFDFVQRYDDQRRWGAPFNWKNPEQCVTQPMPLMGEQMGVVEMPGIPSLGYEYDGNVKVFHLKAQPVEKIMVDARHSTYEHLIPDYNKYAGTMNPKMYQVVHAWGYNGTTPGPVIEAIEGDTIRVVVTNELLEPTSIHWHGIELPNEQDGATPETARPIMPGETFTYEFTLYQVGTFMYHSGFNVMKQDHMGLNGVVVVHPKNGYSKKIDRHIVIMLQQWALIPGNTVPDVTTMDFNWFTFNGFAAPNIPVIELQQGERVRLHFANTIMDAHPIHIHGYSWLEVGTDGGPIAKTAQRKSSTINVPAGTTREVQFVAWNPGLWRLHCHKLHHIVNSHTDVPMSVMAHGGMFTLVHVKSQDPSAPWQHPSQGGFDAY